MYFVLQVSEGLTLQRLLPYTCLIFLHGSLFSQNDGHSVDSAEATKYKMKQYNIICLVNCPHSGSSSTTASRRLFMSHRIEIQQKCQLPRREKLESARRKTSSVRGTTNSRRAWPPFAPREEKTIEKNRRSVFSLLLTGTPAFFKP